MNAIYSLALVLFYFLFSCPNIFFQFIKGKIGSFSHQRQLHRYSGIQSGLLFFPVDWVLIRLLNSVLPTKTLLIN